MALNTKIFIENLIINGYTHLCVVPCSFAQFVINEAINNPNIEYVPCASEAIACSIAAGLKMAGGKPIVIIQSSGITNIGSCITSLLKPYNITFPILVSWRTYTNGDSEIQHQYLSTKLLELIEAYGYSHVILNQQNIDEAINQIEFSNIMETICVIKKNSFSEIFLNKEHQLMLENYIPRSKFLMELNNEFKNTNTIFIGTTGNTSREMFNFMKDTNNFYMVGNMGGALSLGLGAAKVNKKVIVCGGDAEFVMHMGGLTTAGRYAKEINLIYILFDNESNKSTGGQNTYQSHINYIEIAKASGLKTFSNIIFTLNDFAETLKKIHKQEGLIFIHVKCGYDEEVNRPQINDIKVNRFN